jgi:hypothetical protein
MAGRSRRPLLRGAIVASLLTSVALVSSSAANAAPLPTVSITISKSGITVGGTLQSGGVSVVTTAATGLKEPSPTLVLLKPGVSAASLLAYLATNKITSDPNASSKFGSIVFDTEGSGAVETTLAPGQYVALNAEGEKSSKWTSTTFAVAESATPVALPTPQATEKSIDFAFRGPKVLKVGELVRFENEGYLVHMDIAFPVKSKKAAAKVLAGFATGHEKGLQKLLTGPPPGFVGPISSGAYQQETITAKPGWYVQVCFMPTQDGRPHTLIGMERIIQIVK